MLSPDSKNSKLASVVVSYYKNLPNLELVLLALHRQTAREKFEVILSEDDDAPETKVFVEKMRSHFSFPLIHLSQPDHGFRKCDALNKAVCAATTDFLIFLDGDCIPHKRLVKEYLDAKQEGRVLYGRRVMLSEKRSAQLLKQKNLSALNLFSLISGRSKRVEEGFYLKWVPQKLKEKKSARLLGCNMGITKKDLIAINGFDEDYIAPGCGEDTDIEWRFGASGNVSFYSMKFRAIVYHIYHQERFTKKMEDENQIILTKKIGEGFFVCKNGIKKL